VAHVGMGRPLRGSFNPPYRMKALLPLLQLLSGMCFFATGIMQAVNSQGWLCLASFAAGTVWLAAFVVTLHKNMNQHE